MENGSLRILKNRIMTISILGLVLVAASFAGTIMIGSANAQSSKASENACPTNFTLQQGQCTKPAECPPMTGFSVSGPSGARGQCTYTCIDSSICDSQGIIRFACPPISQLAGDQCVTRPGRSG